MSNTDSAVATSLDPRLAPAGDSSDRHGFEPATIIVGSDDDTRSIAQAADIADAMISLIRTYGNLKSRIASSADPEIASLFLLVRLVKEGPKRAKELADSMCADQSTVSRQVAGLVRSGLIERQADPDDGRASILVPTAVGIERVHEHFVHRGRAIEPIISDWPEVDREHLLRLLRRYNATLDLRREEVLASMARTHTLVSPAPTDTDSHRSHPHARTERSN